MTYYRLEQAHQIDALLMVMTTDTMQALVPECMRATCGQCMHKIHMHAWPACKHAHVMHLVLSLLYQIVTGMPVHNELQLHAIESAKESSAHLERKFCETRCLRVCGKISQIGRVFAARPLPSTVSRECQCSRSLCSGSDRHHLALHHCPSAPQDHHPVSHELKANELALPACSK